MMDFKGIVLMTIAAAICLLKIALLPFSYGTTFLQQKPFECFNRLFWFQKMFEFLYMAGVSLTKKGYEKSTSKAIQVYDATLGRAVEWIKDKFGYLPLAIMPTRICQLEAEIETLKKQVHDLSIARAPFVARVDSESVSAAHTSVTAKSSKVGSIENVF